MTIPERRLWNLLRNRQLAGLKFRRQAPIGPFVVDFYCEAAKLAVELDGVSHDNRGDYDKRRQRFLEAAGLTVFRVSNDAVLKDAEAVLLGIAKAAHIDLRSYYGNLFGGAQATSATASQPLTPDPSPQGEGGEFRGESRSSRVQGNSRRQDLTKPTANPTKQRRPPKPL